MFMLPLSALALSLAALPQDSVENPLTVSFAFDDAAGIVTEATGEGAPLAVGYALDPCVNENRGQTWDPFHQVTSYLVLYREAEAE